MPWKESGIIHVCMVPTIDIFRCRTNFDRPLHQRFEASKEIRLRLKAICVRIGKFYVALFMQLHIVAFVIIPFVEREESHSKGFFLEVLRSLITPAGSNAGFNVKTANRQRSSSRSRTGVIPRRRAECVRLRTSPGS